jgi:hypothetical protein
MPMENPQLGKIQEGIYVKKILILGSRFRKECKSCPALCGRSKLSIMGTPGVAGLYFCLLQGSFPIVWCGAPAMNKENV